jgi:hypothetical protein
MMIPNPDELLTAPKVLEILLDFKATHAGQIKKASLSAFVSSSSCFFFFSFFFQSRTELSYFVEQNGRCAGEH